MSNEKGEGGASGAEGDESEFIGRREGLRVGRR